MEGEEGEDEEEPAPEPERMSYSNPSFQDSGSRLSNSADFHASWEDQFAERMARLVCGSLNGEGEDTADVAGMGLSTIAADEYPPLHECTCLYREERHPVTVDTQLMHDSLRDELGIPDSMEFDVHIHNADTNEYHEYDAHFDELEVDAGTVFKVVAREPHVTAKEQLDRDRQAMREHVGS